MTGEITQASSNFFFFKSTGSMDPASYTIAMHEFSNGAWRLKECDSYNSGSLTGTATYSPSLLSFPPSLAVGYSDVQTVTLLNTGGRSQTLLEETCVDGIETISVPAGTFSNALKITKKETLVGSTTTTSTYWYASGAGLVKIVNPSCTWELSSYTIR